MRMNVSDGSSVQFPVFFEVQAAPSAGIDLLNADATVITQEMTGLDALAPGALVGTRTGADGQLTYLPGVVYGPPSPDR